MASTKTQSRSKSLDKFYTRPSTVAACLAHLNAALPNLNADLYLEPAAGSGTFLAQMPHPRKGLDLEPEGSDIETADFLTWEPASDLQNIVVIGNPPFGSNAALAVAFFNRAADYAQVIAMIMPASMLKGSMQNRLNAKFHLVSEMHLDAEPFLLDGNLHRVNTVFQVWQRGTTSRPKSVAQTKHQDFSFVAAVDDADFVVRRVGARAGAIITISTQDKSARGLSAESNLFIKANGIDPTHLEAMFRRLDFSEIRRRAAANFSVSKTEIVVLYDALLKLEAISEVADPKATTTEYEQRSNNPCTVRQHNNAAYEGLKCPRSCSTTMCPKGAPDTLDCWGYVGSATVSSSDKDEGP